MSLTYKELRKIINYLGYELVAQKGSHQKFRRGSQTLEIPVHKELAKGTARTILGDIAEQNNINLDDLKKEYQIKI